VEELLRVELEMVADTTARMPLEMVVPFMPYAMQVVLAAPLPQEIDFPAAVAALPAVTVTAEKSVAE
jgi:hypothetical protein